MPYPNGRAPARAIAVAVLSCCTRCPGFRISLLTSGAMGIRTPDLLHAIQRQPVHRSPSAQVTVPASTQQSTAIQTRCGTSLLYGPDAPPRCSSAESRSGQRREILCCHAPDFTHLPNRGRSSSANLCVGRYCTSGCGELVLSIATRIQARLPNRAQGVDPVLRSVGCQLGLGWWVVASAGRGACARSSPVRFAGISVVLGWHSRG